MATRHTKRLVFATLAGAGLLGAEADAALTVFQLDDPLIFINSTGRTTYDASSNLFTVTGVPKLWDIRGVATDMADAGGVLSGAFTLSAHVDETGTFTSGVPGHDMVMTGDVDVDGDGSIDFSGTLLTGEVTNVGWLDIGAGLIDLFDQTIAITGGQLASFYPDGAGFSYSAENSTFTGDFTTSFTAGAKGNFGGIPAPGAASLLALGVAAGARRRR